MKNFLLAFTALCLLSVVARAESLSSIPLKTLDGKDANFSDYKGKVVLVVNVASKCGNTPQYKALEALYEKYKEQGFVILGFPCNQFHGQEPGTPEEIQKFCTQTYGVTFPMFDKIEVNGAGRHPLYTELAGPASPFPGDIKWNFTKFLIGRDGKILARFEPGTKPDSPQVSTAVATAVAAK